MNSTLLVVPFTLLLLAGAVVKLVRMRNMQYWIGSHLRAAPRLGTKRPALRHVYFCFADHYEPYGGTQDSERARRRVQQWVDQYPAIAAQHRDSSGRPPQHSYFYPAEEYDPALLDHLAGLSRAGFGDVEVHLHHDNDSADNLRRTLIEFTRTLHERHGLLRRDPRSGRLQYVFIHGNWALDNSRPDGRWCGVDNELDVLVETGCDADMTMPSAPSDTQTRKINSLYFARGHAGCRKSHDRGRDVSVGDWGRPGELLMIQGPLTLNWREGKFGLLPRIESAELSYDAPPTAHRVALWGRCGIAVRGAEEHVFIKVHTHGATEGSMKMLFEQGGFHRLWSELERQYRDRPGCQLHYVTAWQMVQKIHELAAAGSATRAG
ncbi:MAG: hypothetical protein WA210_07540 [Burkholderiaceae bacterium]